MLQLIRMPEVHYHNGLGNRLQQERERRLSYRGGFYIHASSALRAFIEKAALHGSVPYVCMSANKGTT